jgi:hypothetical protein
MLYAGSLELLDLLGIYEKIADVGFIVRYVIDLPCALAKN